VFRDEATYTIVVYSREQAVAALQGAADCDVMVAIESLAGVGTSIGAPIFREIITIASATVPRARFIAILDCGEEAGSALAAIDAGITRIRVHLGDEAYRRLAAIAAQRGCKLENGSASRPLLDLADCPDPRSTCVNWLREAVFGAQDGPKAELPSHRGSCM
jgi:hypothetical protein